MTEFQDLGDANKFTVAPVNDRWGPRSSEDIEVSGRRLEEKHRNEKLRLVVGSSVTLRDESTGCLASDFIVDALQSDQGIYRVRNPRTHELMQIGDERLRELNPFVYATTARELMEALDNGCPNDLRGVAYRRKFLRDKETQIWVERQRMEGDLVVSTGLTTEELRACIKTDLAAIEAASASQRPILMSPSTGGLRSALERLWLEKLKGQKI